MNKIIRKSIKSISMLVVIILACISLPLSMIAVGNESTIINNYYIDNENQKPEHFIYPLEIITYYEVIQLEYFSVRNFNLTEANTIIIIANWTGSNEPLYFLVVDSCMDNFYDNNYEYAYTYKSGRDTYWDIPFEKNWYIIMYSGQFVGNITISFEII